MIFYLHRNMLNNLYITIFVLDGYLQRKLKYIFGIIIITAVNNTRSP